MARSARPRRLEVLGPLANHFHRRSGKVSEYREFLFFNDGDWAVAGFIEREVTRPFRVNGETIFDDAFMAFRVQRKGSTFTTIAMYDLEERFLGTYSDTTTPWAGVRSAGAARFETDLDDLYLDYFISPGGRRFVLDLGEFHEGVLSGRLTPPEAELALETVTWMDAEAGAGRYPSQVLEGFALEPRLLSDLPYSQEWQAQEGG